MWGSVHRGCTNIIPLRMLIPGKAAIDRLPDAMAAIILPQGRIADQIALHVDAGHSRIDDKWRCRLAPRTPAIGGPPDLWLPPLIIRACADKPTIRIEEEPTAYRLVKVADEGPFAEQTGREKYDE